LLPVLERFQRLFELIILLPLVAIEPPAQAVELPLNLLAAEHGQLALHAVTLRLIATAPAGGVPVGRPRPDCVQGGVCAHGADGIRVAEAANTLPAARRVGPNQANRDNSACTITPV
jgi:hypothetical protein